MRTRKNILKIPEYPKPLPIHAIVLKRGDAKLIDIIDLSHLPDNDRDKYFSTTPLLFRRGDEVSLHSGNDVKTFKC